MTNKISLAMTLFFEKEYKIQIDTQKLKEGLSEFAEIKSIDILGENNVVCLGEDFFFGFTDLLVNLHFRSFENEYQKLEAGEDILLPDVLLVFFQSISNAKNENKILMEGGFTVEKKYKDIEEKVMDGFIDKTFLENFQKKDETEDVRIHGIELIATVNGKQNLLNIECNEENLLIKVFFPGIINIIYGEKENVKEASKDLLNIIKESIRTSSSFFSFFNDILVKKRGDVIEKRN